MNDVKLLGNLGSDPELRTTQAGKPVCNFRIATNESYRDASGQVNQRTEWHRIVVWGKAAQNCQKYLKKGAAVLVEGSLRTRDWQDRDGQKRYTTEIHTVKVRFLSSAKSQAATNTASAEDEVIPSDAELEAVFAGDNAAA